MWSRPLGTALTVEHIHMLRRLAPSVMLVFDGDAAGLHAALRTLDLFMNSGVDVRVMLLPAGEDPDTYVRNYGIEAFRALEATAPTLLDFAITSVLDKAQKDSVQDRLKRADEILSILHKTKNPLEKDEYLKQVSDRLGFRQDLLRKRLPSLRVRVQGATSSPKPVEKPTTLALPAGLRVERDVISLLLQGRLDPEQIRQLDEAEFTGAIYRHILGKAVRYCDPDGHMDLEAIRGELSEDPAYDSVVAQLSVQDLNLEDIAGYVDGCLRTLKRKQVQRNTRWV